MRGKAFAHQKTFVGIFEIKNQAAVPHDQAVHTFTDIVATEEDVTSFNVSNDVRGGSNQVYIVTIVTYKTTKQETRDSVEKKFMEKRRSS